MQNTNFECSLEVKVGTQMRPAQYLLFTSLFKLHNSHKSCKNFVTIPRFILFQAGGTI